ncbi:MAG: hypothetical protein D6768_17540 [Chloroflexi bacterium]|nr:MAG: hypothetical protein D6768_17540 [Chloroflexota bacterium]
MDLESMAYIKSESEFSNARLRGFLQSVMGLIRGHNMHLLSFGEVVEKLRLKQSIYLGLQDIPVKNIVGSTGRYEDFTRTFLPRTGDKRAKERWRNIYTLAVTGKGFPPIDVYKIDQVYFVKDGNHRVSVARDLGWETIQAYVTELPSSISLEPDVEPDDLLVKEECAWFLQQTQLDKTRPDSKTRIDFTEPGGYQRLLKHIELHRYLMHLEQDPQGDEPISLPDAAADWYDNVFTPIIDEMHKSDIIRHFPGRSESDLYMWLIRYQARLRERYQLAQVELPEMARDFLASVDD